MLRNISLLVSKQRSLNVDASLALFQKIGRIVEHVDNGIYQDYEATARARIDLRDSDDWPIVAVALLLRLPIWTEDRDFFGSGIATWTTDRVELYLNEL